MKQLDDLQMYFGHSLRIDDRITVKHPRIGAIIDYGEQRYRRIIGALTTSPSMMISVLDDMGVDWETISDFELFTGYLRNMLTDEDSAFIFDGLRLNEYNAVRNANGELLLRSVVTGHEIGQEQYWAIAEFMRRVHGTKHVVRKAGNFITKRRIIEADREERMTEAANRKEETSYLLPIISALLNSPGFKYNLEQIRDLPYFTVTESLKRITAIRQADALLNGAYCGMADLSKIPKMEFDWIRDLSKDG